MYVVVDEGLAGDPELEAAAKAERAKQLQQVLDSEEEEDEDEWTPKDAAAVAKKEKQMAKRGFVFQSAMSNAKVSKEFYPENLSHLRFLP